MLLKKGKENGQFIKMLTVPTYNKFFKDAESTR